MVKFRRHHKKNMWCYIPIRQSDGLWWSIFKKKKSPALKYRSLCCFCEPKEQCQHQNDFFFSLKFKSCCWKFRKTTKTLRTLKKIHVVPSCASFACQYNRSKSRFGCRTCWCFFGILGSLRGSNDKVLLLMATRNPGSTHQLRLVVYCRVYYLQGSIHPRWLFGISSINSVTHNIDVEPEHHHFDMLWQLISCSISFHLKKLQ